MNPEALILKQIRELVDFVDISPISKGYSSDLKYLLITTSGKKYLARIIISDESRVLKSGENQYNLLKALRQYSVLVPEPHHFKITDDHRSCLMILDYIDGEDGEEVLNLMSSEDQYRVGYQSGEELKKLHQLPAPPDIASWNILKKRKYEWYCAEFLRNPVKVADINLDIIQQYVSDHLHLMEGTRQTFQHDDYHPANLIFQNRQLKGIIDFNRSDWGDPIHDFYKVALFTRHISVPFARGQVDGYWSGSIPPDFWQKYALYCAMSIIPDLVWSGRHTSQTGSDELDRSIRRLQAMIEDHEGFARVVPQWYANAGETQMSSEQTE